MTDAYKARKALNGLVIGPLDKNNGELWACCPVLYERALTKLYSEDMGYVEETPRRVTPARLRRHGPEGITRYAIQPRPPRRRDERGSMADVVSAWGHLYRARGWGKYGRFDTKGRISEPYALFKAKNVTDSRIRDNRWDRARPIAPDVHNPMAVMLHKAGRAWYHMVNNREGDHFPMPKIKAIPHCLAAGIERLRQLGTVEVTTLDVEGCFSYMPTAAIRLAMRDLAERFRKTGRSGIWVPRADTRPCSWEQPSKGYGTWMYISDLVDILEFALDNAYIKMSDGRILRQAQGIPMGGPLSPAMCNGTCAWMEEEWLAGLDPTTRIFFEAYRYMDDILLLTSGNRRWRRGDFMDDFLASQCYWEPLHLTPGAPDVFLETTFTINTKGQVSHRLKNANETGCNVWRYHHYGSHIDYATKRKVLLSTLRKVDDMASDSVQLARSARAKLMEFANLGYPKGILHFMCGIVALESNEPATWRSMGGLVYNF